MSKQLDMLPKSISSKVISEPKALKLNGMTSDLEYYPPVVGKNIGILFYKEDEFEKDFEVNPHKVNFGKDRDQLQIGSTNYNVRIRRMVNDTLVCFSLQLDKGEVSPLFVPYRKSADKPKKEEDTPIAKVFLVLEPTN